MKKPNILFILTDDQRADTIGAWGNREIQTPWMDSLVSQGVSFTRSYIMGGTNPAVCMPSRAMLMSGRSLFRVGGKAGEIIPPEHVTLPEHLRNSGYHTHHIGKWHQDRQSFARSFSSGNRIFGFTPGWYVQYGGHWNVAVHDFDPSGEYNPKAGYLLAADKHTRHPLIPGMGGVHSSEMFSDAAVDFISGYAKGQAGRAGQPFFLYLAYVAPHDPRQAPDEYENRYDPQRISEPQAFLERHPFDNGEFSIRDEMLEGWPRRSHAIRRHLADYYATISHLDAQIGRVLTALRESGQDENTLIIFASDNGLAIGSHGLMGKQNLYEHSIRVPLIMRGPGIAPGSSCAAPCYLFDIYPTLCEILDLSAPSSVEGRSLVPAMGGTVTPARETMYFAYGGVQRAISDMRFKLIEYATGVERHTQLFDIAADPYEKHDLGGRPNFQKKTNDMRAALLRSKGELGDDREQEASFWRIYGKP